jgi:hypothetical protein
MMSDRSSHGSRRGFASMDEASQANARQRARDKAGRREGCTHEFMSACPGSARQKKGWRDPRRGAASGRMAGIPFPAGIGQRRRCHTLAAAGGCRPRETPEGPVTRSATLPSIPFFARIFRFRFHRDPSRISAPSEIFHSALLLYDD